jgi:hypothetical protein
MVSITADQKNDIEENDMSDRIKDQDRFHRQSQFHPDPWQKLTEGQNKPAMLYMKPLCVDHMEDIVR